jgi:plasmid maintenance system antidote protein VapI
MLGISRQQLHAILAARKPVSPDIAARLGKLFGNGPGLWLRLQAAYDAWYAEREVDVSAVPSLKVAYHHSHSGGIGVQHGPEYARVTKSVTF